jgi:hypothetical protein
METNNTNASATPIEHQNVPQEHQGLHGFLYSSDREHAALDSNTTGIESDGSEVVSIDIWCDRAANAKLAGVYEVLDRDRRVQYVGVSRNVMLSLNSHVAQLGSDTCAFVRVKTFKFPKRSEMDALRDTWLTKQDRLPPGNASQSALWAGTIGEAAIVAMSEVERNAYEEKKLKMRKAMADSNLSKELESNPPNDLAEAERRQNLEAAVKNDDWSAVINAQKQSN